MMLTALAERIHCALSTVLAKFSLLTPLAEGKPANTARFNCEGGKEDAPFVCGRELVADSVRGREREVLLASLAGERARETLLAKLAARAMLTTLA